MKNEPDKKQDALEKKLEKIIRQLRRERQALEKVLKDPGEKAKKNK